MFYSISREPTLRIAKFEGIAFMTQILLGLGLDLLLLASMTIVESRPGFAEVCCEIIIVTMGEGVEKCLNFA